MGDNILKIGRDKSCRAPPPLDSIAAEVPINYRFLFILYTSRFLLKSRQAYIQCYIVLFITYTVGLLLFILVLYL